MCEFPRRCRTPLETLTNMQQTEKQATGKQRLLIVTQSRRVT